MPSNMGVDIQLNEGQAAPFTLLLVVYDAKLALKSCPWEQLDILRQCQMLQPDRIDSKSQRQSLMNELIQDSGFNDLKHKPYLRIRIKSVLSRFYKETLRLNSSKNIKQWTGHQLLVSFIAYLISISNKPEYQKAAGHPKVWRWMDFLRKYYHETNYDGNALLTAFKESKKPNGSKGFGLMMMRTVCDRYELKSGPYSKVKKQCNFWATRLHEQSQGMAVQAPPSGKQKGNKYVSTVSQMVQDQKSNIDDADTSNSNKVSPSNVAIVSNGGGGDIYVTKSNHGDPLNGRCWYWLCDFDGGLKWIPYRENDVKILNAAWRNKEKSVVILEGRYRVEFIYANSNAPCGNQFNQSISNPQSRTTKCFIPRSTHFGVPVDKKPL